MPRQKIYPFYTENSPALLFVEQVRAQLLEGATVVHGSQGRGGAIDAWHQYRFAKPPFHAAIRLVNKIVPFEVFAPLIALE